MRRSGNDPSVDPTIIQLFDPAVIERVRPIESRFRTEVRSVGTPADQPDDAPPRADTPPAESNSRKRVEDFLAKCIVEKRKVTSRQVEVETKVKQGTVRGLPAWKAYRAHIASDGRRSTDAMTRARHLPEGAKSIIPGKVVDPADAVEAQEAAELARRIMTEPDYRDFVEREFLEDENVATARKAAYRKMSEAEKTQFLITWKAYGMDE
jgi:hypothetical protein